MKYLSFISVVIFFNFFINVSAHSQLRLPAVISSGMVLHQKDSVNLWGWSNPGGKVYVITGWDKHTDSTICSNGATWKLKVATPNAGGPYEIEIISQRTFYIPKPDRIILKDVLIGEIWVCSGQSNMELSYNDGEKDVAGELSNAYNPNIRFFEVPKTTSAYPQDDVKAIWTVCDSNTIKSFSAVGYFFGKKLNQTMNVPVGLINASWGGTPAETWTPSELVEGDSALMTAASKIKTVDWRPSKPGSTFNGMIAPLSNFNITGSIWYQGEGNVNASNTYSKLFTTMIDGWRKAWEKEFPFYYVQIAPYDYDGDNNKGALLREAQTHSMSHHNVGMVVTTDLFDSVTNIHPSRKREVGNRLANWALSETYKQKGVLHKSPVFTKAEKKSNKIILSFENVPTGLMSKDKQIKGFYISDVKNDWYPAEAKIEENRIVIWNNKIKNPTFVRYGFSNTLVGNVSSREGLPLIPFRTDNLE